VRQRGFDAVAEYSRKFDGFGLTRSNTAVTPQEFREARALVSIAERRAIIEMKRRIEGFAKFQRAAIKDIMRKTREGTTALVFKPVERIGVYVPGGRAPLFSSLVMAAVPARCAGVKDIVVCTPPQKDGKVNPFVLVAAEACGVNKVFKIGGAQAIGAMAYGLDRVMAPVDLICGPGNAFVSAAKQQAAAGGTRIDVPAGPSEALVIADGSVSPAFVAADMLAQAEHGPDSAAICICTSAKAAAMVAAELERQLAALPPGSPARQSIPKWGRIFVAKSVEEAVEAANEFAPEHLELLVKGAGRLVPLVRNVGAVFVGTAEAFCDYGMSGGNHILPTGAAARAWSGVSVQTFGKLVYVDELTGAAQRKLAAVSARLARMEGLEAHARAAEARDANG